MTHKAVIAGTHLALHQMRNQKPQGGIIVNIASMAGFIPSIMQPVYTAAKFGVVGFTRSFEPSLLASHGVRINAVAPTFAETPLVTKMTATDAGLFEP